MKRWDARWMKHTTKARQIGLYRHGMNATLTLLLKWEMAMSVEEERARSAQIKSGPFSPAPATTDPDQRIAHAIEYIAFQLGEISAKLDRLLPKSKC